MGARQPGSGRQGPRASSRRPLLDRLRIEATAGGIRRLELGSGDDRAAPGGWRHLRRARRELREYLGGRRRTFTVPLDLRGLGPFRTRVLRAVSAVAFGDVTSYSALARRIGRPRAARAVGNAVATNPLPLFVPCHRVLRRDGTWGPYALGPDIKTRLLALEGRAQASGRQGVRRC
jgi:methylated-DNA-[protein]-cysteine S-methyltransferase